METNLETTILQNLLQNEEFCRKVIPYIKPKYFQGVHRTIFKEVCLFVGKYNKLPDLASLSVEINESIDGNEIYREASALIPTLYSPQMPSSEAWLLDKTEEWCQRSAMEIAILESVEIISGRDTKRDRGAIPHLMRDALSISFDGSIGHDYFDDAADRWDRYHNKENKIEFDLDVFNDVTDGGYESKTLNAFIAGIHVGKSLLMCSMAASAIMQNKKVLYISMEMSEEKISERIDANLMNRDINNLGDLSKEQFLEKIEKLKKKTKGNLKAKQYPTAAAHVGHFRALLEELKLKSDFVPDVIFIDYLNICASERVKSISNGGTYVLVKAIAEELRGLAIEYDLPIWTATQFTRSGMNDSDPDMTQTSESIGLPATLDLFWAISQPDQFKESNQYLIKQLKNRYKNLGYKEKFVIGVDKPKMQVFDVANQAQQGIMDSSGNISKPPTEYQFDFGDE